MKKRINWEKLWRDFDRWYKRREDSSALDGWRWQKREIQRLVEKARNDGEE